MMKDGKFKVGDLVRWASGSRVNPDMNLEPLGRVVSVYHDTERVHVHWADSTESCPYAYNASSLEIATVGPWGEPLETSDVEDELADLRNRVQPAVSVCAVVRDELMGVSAPDNVRDMARKAVDRIMGKDG